MSKSFKSAKKPTTLSPEDMASFENAGIGHDHKSTNVQTPISTKEGMSKTSNEVSLEDTEPQTHIEPSKRLSLDLPQTMHRRFKTACSANNTKMAAELTTFIERRIQELEEEAGLLHKST